MLQKIVCSLATWGQGEEKSRIFQLMIHVYLVVDLPHWKMMEFVSWDYDIPNIWNNKKCSKPLTSSLLGSKGYCNGATVGLHIAQIVRFWNSSPLGHFTNIFPYDFGVVGYLSDRQQENEGYMIIYIIYKYIHTVYIYTHTVCVYIYSILYIYVYLYRIGISWEISPTWYDSVLKTSLNTFPRIKLHGIDRVSLVIHYEWNSKIHG